MFIRCALVSFGTILDYSGTCYGTEPMQRSIFIVFLVLLNVGVVVAGTAWQKAHPISSDSAAVACEILDMADSPQNIEVALAIDTLYEKMPAINMPAMVVNQEDPFTVGCIPAE